MNEGCGCWPGSSQVHLCMKCSLGISNFLEEISSLPHSIFSLYFFAMITEKGFLISPCYSLELCIQMLISFLLHCPDPRGALPLGHHLVLHPQEVPAVAAVAGCSCDGGGDTVPQLPPHPSS